MAKEWMKFDCRSAGCGMENWIYEDPETFGRESRERIILSCSECGTVLGWFKSKEVDDKGQSCCVCIPFTGIEQGTNGPHGGCPMDDTTVWSTVGGDTLNREKFMAKYGKDPYVQWCKSNPNAPICVGFKDRTKNVRKLPDITKDDIDYLPITRRHVKFRPRS